MIWRPWALREGLSLETGPGQGGAVTERRAPQTETHHKLKPTTNRKSEHPILPVITGKVIRRTVKY